MAIQFVPTSQLARLHGVKFLVYGRAGVGKTMLCTTVPRPAIFSAEAGLLSLRKYDLPAHEIKTMADLYEAWYWAHDSAEAKEYDTICLDSISEIGEQVLANAKGSYKDPRQAYGELIDQMYALIKGFRDLPEKHVYFSAKEERIKDDATGVMMLMPGMPGAKVGPAMPYFFDIVLHYGIAKTPDGADYRYLRTQPDFQTEAKDRSGALDPFEEPDLGKIISKILGA